MVKRILKKVDIDKPRPRSIVRCELCDMPATPNLVVNVERRHKDGTTYRTLSRRCLSCYTQGFTAKAN